MSWGDLLASLDFRATWGSVWCKARPGGNPSQELAEAIEQHASCREELWPQAFSFLFPLVLPWPMLEHLQEYRWMMLPPGACLLHWMRACLPPQQITCPWYIDSRGPS